MKKKIFRIPIFVPHKGCPHDCVFCNQRKITGRIKDMTVVDAREIIENHLSDIERKSCGCYAEIAFFGGSFTAIEAERQTELLSLADEYVKSGRVHGIRCSTRPDAINEDIIANCLKFGMTAIELGVQSADNEVLRLSDRGHDFEAVVRAAVLIKNSGISLGLQMMTGLPGDSYERSMQTAERIAELEPDCVRIYPTLVMEDTRLMEMYKDGSYIPQKLSDAVKLASDAAELFISRGIEILRISLQTTDGVNKDTVIGPYHPAFAELVYSELERRRIEEHIIKNSLHDCTIEISRDKASQAIGHKKSNKIYFKNKYNIDLRLANL